MTLRAVGASGAGVLAIGGISFSALHYTPPQDASPGVRRMLSAFPLSTASRIGTTVAALPLPGPLRGKILSSYSPSAVLDAELPISTYKSVEEFWRRDLKAGARSFDADLKTGLSAPCDGVVVAAGPLKNGGCIPLPAGSSSEAVGLRELIAADDRDPLTTTGVGDWETTEMHAVVIHLHAREDSLKVYSPAEWTVANAKHINGGVHWLEEERAYIRNEREAFVGEWGFGTLAMAIVGGPGYGPVLYSGNGSEVVKKCNHNSTGLEMGSVRPQTAVLFVFEVPRDGFAFAVEPGTKVRAGDPLGQVAEGSDKLSEHRFKHMDPTANADSDKQKRSRSRARRRHW